MAVHPDGRTLYVMNYGDGTLDWIDTDSTSATHNQAKKSQDTGTKSRTITLSPDAGSLVVGTDTGLLILDSADGTAKASHDTGKSSKSVKITWDAAMAVILTEDDFILLYDIQEDTPDDQRAKASQDTGTKARGISISPDAGGTVYVTTEDNTVQVYSIVTGGSSAGSASQLGTPFSLVLVQTILVGENPTGIAVDPNTGLIAVVNSGDNTVTLINASGFSEVVEAQLDMNPNTLQLSSKGKFVSAALQFPPFLDPEDVVLSSVILDSTVYALTDKSSLTDKNEDGILELEVKFSRQEVAANIAEGQNVPVRINGLIGTQQFVARDTIRVFRPQVNKPAAGEGVTRNAPYTIEWTPIQSGPVDHVDIYYTMDGGAEWDTVEIGVPDDSSYVWTTPDASSADCEVLIVAMEADDTIVGLGYSGIFVIGTTVTGARDLIPARFALHPVAPNPFKAQTNIRFDLPEPSKVTLRIFALDGSLVKNLAKDAAYPAGTHAVGWNGKNSRDQKVSSGVYFLRVTTKDNTAVRKLVMVSR